MPLSEWKEYKFNDLGEIKTGKTPPNKAGDIWGNSIQFITPTDISNQKYITQTNRGLSDLGLEKVKTCFLPKDSIIVTCIGSDMGKVVINKEDCITNQQINSIIIDKNKFSADYIYYNFSTRKDEFFNLASGGSTMPILNKTAFSNLKIKLPPLSEQQAIAEVLGSLDDKIELNRKMNKTLEDMAQAIFKSWFVDFDPVKAKAEGRTIEGLSQEILDLFPDSFEPSELGDIPKGWKIKKLEDLGDVICGKTPLTSKKEYYGQDIPFITIPDMHGKTFVTETNKTLSKLGADSQKNKYLPPFSISMSCIATPGLVILNPITAQTNQQINSIIPSDVNLSFYYFYLLKQISQTVISNGSGGSVFHNLNTSSFKEIKTTINNKMGLEFNKIIKPIMTQILENQNEIQTLSTIRDTLLPKLISGELRIPDAEKLVESHGIIKQMTEDLK